MKGKAQTVDEAIRIEAYLLSEKAGHPSGMDAYFWEQAQAIRPSAHDGGGRGRQKGRRQETIRRQGQAKGRPQGKARRREANQAESRCQGRQLSLDGSVTPPARKRPAKKLSLPVVGRAPRLPRFGAGHGKERSTDGQWQSGAPKRGRRGARPARRPLRPA